MFEKFGEFKTVEELNMAAAGFLKEGYTESIVALAQENGIDGEDAQDYIDGMTEEFAMPVTAALGRLAKIKEEDIDKEKNMQYRANRNMICMMLRNMATEQDVAAGILKEPNIVAAVVEDMKKHNIYTGTDEDLRRIIRAHIAGEKQVSEETERIKKMYE